MHFTVLIALASAALVMGAPVSYPAAFRAAFRFTTSAMLVTIMSSSLALIWWLIWGKPSRNSWTAWVAFKTCLHNSWIDLEANTDGDLSFLTQPKVLLGPWQILFAMLSSDPALTPTDNEIKGLWFPILVVPGYRDQF